MKTVFIVFYSCVFLCGCGVYYSKEDSQTLSRGTYAVSDSLKNSRIDLAEKYSDDVIKIVTPPKDRVKINPLLKSSQNEKGVKTTEKLIVLSENSTGSTIRVNSKEFNELLQDKETLKAYVDGQKEWEKYSIEVTKKLQEDAANNAKKDALIKEQEKKIAGLKFYRNLVWGICGAIGLAITIYILFFVLKIGAKLAI